MSLTNQIANALPTLVPGGISSLSPAAGSLEQAQAVQTDLLNFACRSAIAAGFYSSALGTPNLYPASSTDQMNLNMRMNAANAALIAVPWVPGATRVKGAVVMAPTKQAFICVKEGTSSANPQNWDVTVGGVVDDGTCVWKTWTTHFKCQDAQGVWSNAVHTATQARQVGIDGEAAISEILKLNSDLQLQVQAANSIESVQAITWPT